MRCPRVSFISFFSRVVGLYEFPGRLVHEWERLMEAPVMRVGLGRMS